MTRLKTKLVSCPHQKECVYHEDGQLVFEMKCPVCGVRCAHADWPEGPYAIAWHDPPEATAEYSDAKTWL